ncbi:MAG: HAD-IC family P-type ATPase [Thermomicrobiales bacterium]
MSVLISTGVLAAYVASIALMFIGNDEVFFEAAAMLVTFVLFGHWMEMKSRKGTSDALRALFDLVPPTATVIRDGRDVEVDTSELVVGDLIRLRPGDKTPVDGEVVEGTTSIDESLVTGESVPVDKRAGDPVIGGSINRSGSVVIRATSVGSDTALAQIVALVDRAQKSKAPGQRIADKAAQYLAILAVTSGVVTFLAWMLFGHVGFAMALTFAISAVVIACPDALGLATPTAVAVGTGIAARHNILIKDAATLEGVAGIDIVVLDKTGTLTEGHPSQVDVATGDGWSDRTCSGSGHQPKQTRSIRFRGRLSMGPKRAELNGPKRNPSKRRLVKGLSRRSRDTRSRSETRGSSKSRGAIPVRSSIVLRSSPAQGQRRSTSLSTDAPPAPCGSGCRQADGGGGDSPIQGGGNRTGDDHRRQRTNRRRGRGKARNRAILLPTFCRKQKAEHVQRLQKGSEWRWLATASTMLPRWHRLISYYDRRRY